MADLSRIFIPKRINTTLRRIYSDRVTVICAPDGTGKSTLIREFTSRTRPDGISVKFITSAQSTGSCFSQICMSVTGKTFSEPVSDNELAVLCKQFSTEPAKKLILIVDCEYAAETLLGNLRTARLLSGCRCANFVFLTGSLNPAYMTLINSLKMTLIEREAISMTPDEIAEYSRRCGLPVNVGAVYSACHGAFLGTRLCFMLTAQGHNPGDFTNEGRLYHAVLEHRSVRSKGAMILATAFDGASREFCEELRSFNPVREYFGEDLLSPGAIFSELMELRREIPLLDINLKRHICAFHPMLKHSVYMLFSTLPENVRHDLRICYGREYLRLREDYYAFCEFFLAGEYELAAGIYNTDSITYSLLIKSSYLLQRFITDCPLTLKPAIPRILRISAMLMHTDLKPIVQSRFAEVIAYISESPDYTGPERRELLSYAYALRTNEDLYTLNKMGDNIKRAYDLFRGKREFEPPVFAWTMYAPTVFFLLHRRGYSIHTETAQFTRYQHMYTEMLDHGRYTEIIFTGEAKYVQGDLAGALELLSAAASLSRGTKRIPTRLTAIYCAAKCCLFLGDHQRFFEYVRTVLSICRANSSREEGDCARLITGLLRALRGGDHDDIWYVLCAENTDPVMNRFTKPYYDMIRLSFFVQRGDVDSLETNIGQYLEDASTAGNEAAGIKLRLIAARGLSRLGSWDAALEYTREALELSMANETVTAPAEFHALYPEHFSQVRELLGEELQPFIDDVIRVGSDFLRGVEAVRSYELTYLANERTDNYAEHYLIPLERLAGSTEKKRRELGLSEMAYSYAIMAASGLSIKEMSLLFNASPDSIKSSLKRTYSSLGVKNRRGLIGIVPTLK